MEASVTTCIVCVFLVLTPRCLVESTTIEAKTASTSTFSFLSSTSPWPSSSTTNPRSNTAEQLPGALDVLFTMSEDSQVNSSIEKFTAAPAATENSTTVAVTMENSTNIPVTTENSTNVPVTTGNSTIVSGTMENSTNVDTNTTDESTQPSTTAMVVFCKNGTCVGNESNCLNDTITDSCILSPSQSCYQIVYENGTDTYYEVGCSSNCEFLVEHTDSITMTTRCCDTDMCNNELLEDPAEGNASMQITIPRYTTLLAILSCMYLK